MLISCHSPLVILADRTQWNNPKRLKYRNQLKAPELNSEIYIKQRECPSTSWRGDVGEGEGGKKPSTYSGWFQRIIGDQWRRKGSGGNSATGNEPQQHPDVDSRTGSLRPKVMSWSQTCLNAGALFWRLLRRARKQGKQWNCCRCKVFSIVYLSSSVH